MVRPPPSESTPFVDFRLKKKSITPLEPILENQRAHISHLVSRDHILPPTADMKLPTTPLTPDNGILFLNNGSKIKNPTNCKTAPPPMWGAVLEEELYDKTQPFYVHKPEAVKEELERRLKEKIESGELQEPDSKRYKIVKKTVYAYELEPKPGTAEDPFDLGQKSTAKIRPP